MLYKLFSAVHRCPPCRALVASLDKEFPEWRKHIEYINADSMSEEQKKEAINLSVFNLPSFTNNKEVLFKGYNAGMVKKIKELCLTKE